MNDVEIRPTIPADLQALARVLVQVHASDGYPVEGVARPLAWLELGSPLGQWTAVVAGDPIGHVALLRPGPEEATLGTLAGLGVPKEEGAVVARLFVSPSHRGRSVASKLMEAVAAFASSQDLQLVLDVMVKDRAAIQLYERLGFKVVARLRHDDGAGNSVPALAMAAPRRGITEVDRRAAAQTQSHRD